MSAHGEPTPAIIGWNQQVPPRRGYRLANCRQWSRRKSTGKVITGFVSASLLAITDDRRSLFQWILMTCKRFSGQTRHRQPQCAHHYGSEAQLRSRTCSHYVLTQNGFLYRDHDGSEQRPRRDFPLLSRSKISRQTSMPTPSQHFIWALMQHFRSSPSRCTWLWHRVLSRGGSVRKRGPQ